MALTKKKGLLLIVLLLVIICLTHKTAFCTNEKSRLATINSVIEKGTFQIDESSPYFNKVDMCFSKGKYYCDKQPFLSLYSAVLIYPLYYILKLNLASRMEIFYYLVSLSSAGLAAIGLFFLLSSATKLLKVNDNVALWVIIFICFGSCILPYSVVYNYHLAEAVLIFAAFHQLLIFRKRNTIMSACLCAFFLGVAALTHVVAAVIFIFMAGLYFLTEKKKFFLSYLVCIFAMALLGATINKIAYGEYKPFYMTPENYIYKGSYWLETLTLCNLTEPIIEKRMMEENFSTEEISRSISQFRNIRQSSSDICVYLLHRFIRYDFLIITPIFILGLFAGIIAVFGNNTFKKEILWVLSGAFLIYLIYACLRGETEGQCFGNRHFLAIVPLVSFLSVFYFRNNSIAPFKVIFWFTFSMIAPSLIQPWNIPNQYFMTINLYLSVILLIFTIIVCGTKGRLIPDSIFSSCEKNKYLGIIFVCLLICFQFFFYSI